MIINIITLVVFSLVFSLTISSTIKTCDRKPSLTSGPKSTNSPPFRIAFKGNSEYYLPKTTYTVLLQSIKTGTNGTTTPSFISFILMVETEDNRNYDEENNDFISGKFQLTGDVRTKISEVCPNTVTQTSLIQKSEVQVYWTAPPTGSGCVIFRATVVEYRDTWYMDDEQLTKKICEENNESNDDNANVVYECCACDEAKFELTFEGLWSRHTHPKDYPDDNWQTRFSDVIGASHTIDYRFWEQGQIASKGMNNLAQYGVTSTLESELKSKSDKIRTIIKARGISYPNVTGKTFAVFRVDQKHHLISVVSFMYPSPDWFVGISGLDLCLPNCNWITNKTINLYPWDAGIDAGVTYNSSKIPQVPMMTVQRVLSSNPNDTSPFYDKTGSPMKPIAKIHLLRQRLYEKSCSEDESKLESTVCNTDSWSEWDECSVTCGMGYSSRFKQHINLEEHKSHCKHLTQSRLCYVVPSCITEDEHLVSNNPKCDVTEYSQLSNCSSACGPGVQAKFRTILNKDVAPKYCLESEMLQHNVDCNSTCPENHDNEDLDSICRKCTLTKWSLWSTCSSECGQGQRQRYRKNLSDTEINCDNRCYTQTINCPDNPPCDNNLPINTTTVPNLESTSITTDSIYPSVTPKYSTGKCKLSKWSSYSNCSNSCGLGFQERTRSIEFPTDPQEKKKCRKKLINRKACTGNQCDKCNYSPWSEWSLCSAQCGIHAIQQRTRTPKNPKLAWCTDRLDQRACLSLACKTN